MVPTVNRVNRENEGTRLRRIKLFWTSSRLNALAKPHPVTKAHRARKVPMEGPVMPVHQETMANPEIKARVAHQAKMAKLVNLVLKALPETRAKPLRKLALQAKKVVQENRALRALQVNLDPAAKTADPAVPVVRVKEALREATANQATPVNPVIKANKVSVILKIDF